MKYFTETPESDFDPNNASNHSARSDVSYVGNSNKSFLSRDEINSKKNLSNKLKLSKRLAYLSDKTSLSPEEAREFDELKKSSDARISNSEKQTLEDLNQTGINSVSLDGKISISQKYGPKYLEQQDSCAIGTLSDKSFAATNPLDFFQNNNPQIIEKHRNCLNGTTLSNFIFKPDQQNYLESQITFNNLGDTRLSMIIEDGAGKIFSISVTKDHNLKDPEIRKHITQGHSDFVIKEVVEGKQKVEGIFRKDFEDPKTNAWATQIGSLGDNRFNQSADKILTGYPYQQFTTNQVSLSQICQAIRDCGEEIIPKNITLVLACDGVWDAIENDYRLEISDNGVSASKNKNENKRNLSDLKQEFKTRSEGKGISLKSKITDKSFAAFLTRKAYKKSSAQYKTSSDNTTTIALEAVKDSKLTISQTIIAAVADGHGESQILDVTDIKNSDGSLVSASAVAMTMTLAKAREIEGLEHQRYVANLLQLRIEKSAIDELSKRDSQDFSGFKDKISAAFDTNSSAEITDILPQDVEENTNKKTTIIEQNPSGCCSPISFLNSLFARSSSQQSSK